MARRQFDEQVEVAVGVGLSAGHGPEDANRACTVALGDRQDLLAPGTDRVESEGHGSSVPWPSAFFRPFPEPPSNNARKRVCAPESGLPELDSAPIPSHGRGQGFESPPLHTRLCLGRRSDGRFAGGRDGQVRHVAHAEPIPQEIPPSTHLVEGLGRSAGARSPIEEMNLGQAAAEELLDNP